MDDLALPPDARTIQVRGDAVGTALITGDGNVVTIVYATEGLRPDFAGFQSQAGRTGGKKTLGPNPYRALDAFDETSSDVFFGREELTSKLLSRLAKLVVPAATGRMRLLAVIGTSGSGKSSLVRAGLVPKLALTEEDRLRGAEVVLLRPGAHPVGALAAALARLVAREPAPLKQQAEFIDQISAAAARGRPDALARLAAMRTGARNNPLIVLVDQFEETYTLCRPTDPKNEKQADETKAERDAFVATLLTAAAEPGGRVCVVFTLRSDFFGVLAEHPALSKAVADSHEIVPAMQRDDLRRAIAGPAREAGYALDEGTVERILDEAEASGAAALPLMQFSLFQIWEGLSKGSSAADTLTRLGGVGGALAGRADDVMAAQPSERERDLAKRAFVATVQLADGEMTDGKLADGERDTRRRAWLREVVPAGMKQDEAQRILKVFADERLLAMGTDRHWRVWIELPHEALIRHWKLLHELVATQRENLRFHRRLNEAATRWAESRANGLLWRRPDLDRLRDFYARLPVSMTELEVEFYRYSQRGRRRELAVRFGWMALVAVISISSLVVIAAVQAERNARLEREQSRFLTFLSRQQTEAGDGMTGMLLALEALPKNPDSSDPQVVRNAQLALYSAVQGNRELRILPAPLAEKMSPTAIQRPSEGVRRITAVRFSPDGRRILTTSADGTARVWDGETGAELRVLKGQTAIVLAAYHPTDSTLAATVSAGGAVYLWNTETGEELHMLHARGDPVNSVAFSADGRVLVTASADGLARAWDAVDGRLLALFGEPENGAVKGVAVSRDGKRLLTLSGDGRARVWNTDEPDDFRTLAGNHGLAVAVSFGPGDGQVTAVWSDGTLTTELATGSGQRASYKLGDGVRYAEFSPSRSRVVALMADQTTRVWDVQSGQEIGRPKKENEGQVIAGVFNPDESVLATLAAGDSLATVSLPYPVRLWDVATGDLVATLRGHSMVVGSAAFSPDGTRITTGSEDGTARMWDARPSRSLAVLPDFRKPLVRSARNSEELKAARLMDDRPFAFGPDGTQLAAASQDHGLVLWNVTRGVPLRYFPERDAPVSNVAFNPRDGSQITSGALDGGVRVWDALREVDPVRLEGHKAAISSVIYSDDGRLLLTASLDGTARLWNTRDWSVRAVLQGHTKGIVAAALSPDGRYAATGSEGNAAQLWSTSDGKLVKTYSDHQNRVVAVAFDRYGGLLTGSRDGKARVWDTSEAALRDAQKSSTPVFTLEHEGMVGSATFSSNASRILTTCADGAAYIWDRQTGARLLAIRSGSGAPIKSAMFLPGGPSQDDSMVVTTSRDGAVEIHDIMSGMGVATLTGHRGPIWAASLDPHARLLATGSDDQTLRLWRLLPQGMELMREATSRRTRTLTREDRERFFIAGTPASEKPKTLEIRIPTGSGNAHERP